MTVLQCPRLPRPPAGELYRSAAESPLSSRRRKRGPPMGRISDERMLKALEQQKTISKEDHAKIKALAAIVKCPRSFIFKTPDDYGLKGWYDLVIKSDDGTPLE